VGGLARQGVLIKRLDALEALATVDTLVLDKTGTLTREAMAFEGTWPAQASPDLIARAAALATLSQHPYARALVQAMGQQVPLDSLAAVPAGSLPAPGWRDVQEFPGRGLQARDAAGECWRLGSSAWASEGARADDAAARCEAAGCQVVLVGHVSGRTLGFRWAEQLRPQAREAVLALQAQGLAVRVLSGDAPARVELLAQQAGIAQAQGGKSPQQKLDALAQLQAQGRKVWVVGDGINDAPMLARADVSLAMGHAAMTAQASADGVIVAESLLALVQVRAMAQAVVRVVRRNLVWAAAYNATCIPLAVMGWLPPWAAGLGMALSSAGVVMYSATLLRPARAELPPIRH
jgi:Cu2+-exporting ATPase